MPSSRDFLNKANKNFNSGAIIATPKRQLLAQKRHTTYRPLRFVHPLLRILSRNLKILRFTMLSIGQTPTKVPLPVRASTFPCNTCSLGQFDSAS